MFRTVSFGLFAVMLTSDRSFADWQLNSTFDATREQSIRYATLEPAGLSGGVGARLVLACANSQKEYAIILDGPLNQGSLSATLKQDDQAIERRRLTVSSDRNRVPIPDDLSGVKRFRIQLMPSGGPVMAYDFNLGASRNIASRLSC